jgi:uncharacterized protein YjiS (DUF1127 family)
MTSRTLLTRLADALRVWRRYMTTLEELSSLPDGVLMDLGTHRRQVRHFAWRTARQDDAATPESRRSALVAEERGRLRDETATR